MITKGMGKGGGLLTNGMGGIKLIYAEVLKFVSKITKEVLFDSNIS